MAKSLKSLAKDWTPPALLRRAQTLRHGPKRCPTWEAAKAACQGYSAGRVNQFRADRARLNQECGWAPETLGSPLALFVAATPDPLHIVDLGGASGEFGAAILNIRSGLIYSVVENPTMAGLKPLEDIEYITQIPPECDVFFTSCTVQYLDDPYGAAEAGLKSAQRAAMFVRNSFSENLAYTAQTSLLFDNGGGYIPAGYNNDRISYAHQTISEARIYDLARRHGFRLVYRSPNAHGVPIGIDAYGADLVFTR